MTTDLRRRIAELSSEDRARFERELLKQNIARDNRKTIPRRELSSSYPLSFAQARLFFLYQLEPSSVAYNQPKVLRIAGPLNMGVMTKVLNAIVERHEILRSTFSLHNGTPIQTPIKEYLVELPLFDLSHGSVEHREGAARKLIAEICQRPFNLSTDLMLRTALLRLSPVEHILLLVTHHIVSDASSRDILFREIASLYDGYSTESIVPRSDLPIQYGDFALWQRTSLEKLSAEKQLLYWRKQLEGVPTYLRLPTDHPRSSAQRYRGSSETVVIAPPLAHRLRSLSQQQSTTMFMTLLAAFQVFLLRYTGQDDFIVGVPISGRRLPELENLVGFFVSSLLMRAKFDHDRPFLNVLAETRETALAAYAHPDIPFERLLEEFQPERNLSFHPMFQVVFAFRKDFRTPLKAAGLIFTPMDVDIGTTKFDLALSVTDCSEELLAAFTYNSDLFDAATIQRIAAGFHTLIEAIVTEPGTSIAKLRVLPEAERTKLLVEWNDTKEGHAELGDIHELFEAQVERSPDNVAVVFDDQALTYGELNRRANQLAHYLQKLGVGPEVRVALCLEKSLEMVVALLAVLKAGGAYVPLDPSYPIERLKFIMEDAHTALVLTQQRLAETLRRCGVKLICLDSQWELIAKERETKPPLEISRDNLAYVIYTSGSTGNPKGVAVARGSLCNFVRHTCDVLKFKSDDRVLQFSSIGFDTAVEEIFPCLAGGATLVLRTEGMLDSVSIFLRKCRDWQVSVLDLPTAFWHELAASLSSEELTMPKELRLVIIGGEKAMPERLAQWRRAVDDRVQLLNTYGPSEATVVATMWNEAKFDQAINLLEEVPIGRPISNVQTYILDENLIPVPVRVCGEVHISGAGLARGYLDRPELTAESFIPNPFSDQPGERLYKTSDLGRYRGDGNMEFLGRLDNQVKLRGHRIEIGEIETVLTQNPNVRASAVAIDGANGEERRLVAYVVPNQGCDPAASEFRSFMKSKLPDYMIPSVFVFLESLPITSNGKIDRRALPAPEQFGRETDRPFVAPRTPIEHQLAGIWAEVLKLKEVGVGDNFFDLGGHSLLAMQVISRVLKTFQVNFPLRCLFQAPTVAEMSTLIRELQASNGDTKGVDAILTELEGLAVADAQRSPDSQSKS